MIISVEGNIGSGKSSVLERLPALLPECSVHQEPVDQWGELLSLYYENPAAWSLPFNLRVLHSFATVPQDSSLRIVERSPAACRHVFGQLSYNDGHLTAEAWDVFKEYHDMLGWEPDAYVYLTTPVDVCHQRMQSRGRVCEAAITPEYLGRIDFRYENMLRFTTVPVIRVDGTQAVDDIVTQIAQSCRQLHAA